MRIISTWLRTWLGVRVKDEEKPYGTALGYDTLPEKATSVVSYIANTLYVERKLDKTEL